MIGACLCGEVAFEVADSTGPFELCHCNRCRKASGSAFAAYLTVATEGYRVLRGQHLIRTYKAPLIAKPPRYEVWFCSACGSPVPDPEPVGEVFEIPAGALEGPTNVTPDKHIYVDLKADWDPMDRAIAKFTKDEIWAFRSARGHVVAEKVDELGGQFPLFTYICLGANDLDRAAVFYDAVLAELQLTRCDTTGESGWEDWIGWGIYENGGQTEIALWVCRPENGERATAGNGTMVALKATSWEQVRGAYRAALANGGTSQGDPGLRRQYNPDFYAAYVRDPDGNKLAFVCRGFTQAGPE